MRRTDDTYKSVDLFGSGKHGFTGGELDVTPATIVQAADMNHLQEELARAVEGAGYTPSGNAYTQLLGALQMADLQRANTAPLWTTPGTPTLNAIAGGVSVTDNDDRAVAVGPGGVIYRLHSTEQFVSDTAGSSFSGTFNDVAATEAGTYGHVAVGAGEEIQTGSAGTWTRRNSTGGLNDLHSVAYNPTNGEVVAVGDAGVIWHGTALATWNLRTSALAGNMTRVVWAPSLGLWIACASDGIQTSPDGITWTQRSAGDFTEVRWIESLGIAVAKLSGGNLYTSVDGVSWSDSGYDPGTSIGGMQVCAGGFIVPSTNKIAGGLWYDGTISTAALITCGARDDGAYHNMSYDPIGRGFWLCGPSGAIGFWPAPWGV